MAKKSFNISSTLSKNKEPQLAAKIPLQKKTKDVKEVAKKVAIIHKTEEPEQKAKAKKETVEKPVKPVKAKADRKKAVKLVRLTIDTPESMHRKLKIKAIEKGVSMRDYILQLLEKELY